MVAGCRFLKENVDALRIETVRYRRVTGNPEVILKFHEKAGRSQVGFVFLSVDPNLFNEPPLSPSFHPQSLLSDDRSLPVGRP